MTHITKTHIKKAMREHHFLGEMINSRMQEMTKAAHSKALKEHHSLGSLIGSLAKGLGKVSPFLKMGGKAIKGIGGIAQSINDSRAAKAQRESEKAQHDAQMRMLSAQTQGIEDQNSHFRKQTQTQKRGGRTKSHCYH